MENKLIIIFWFRKLLWNVKNFESRNIVYKSSNGFNIHF